MEISPEIQSKLDQLAKLPQAARAAIVVVIAGAIAGGYFFLVYQEEAEKLQRLRAQELELQRKLSEVRSIAANITEFEEEIKGLELKLKKVLRQLPNDKELEVLLSDITNLGKTSGIEIKSFQRRDEVTHDFYAEVPIAIELEGDYHSIAAFFDMLAGLPRIVNMGSIDMKVGKESMESTVLKVNGIATTFRFVGNGEGA